MTKVTHDKHKHHRVADKFRGENVSGSLLVKKARRKEKAKEKSGAKFLLKYVPDLSKKQIRSILKGKHTLVGINIFFYALSSAWIKRMKEKGEKGLQKIKEAIKER